VLVRRHELDRTGGGETEQAGAANQRKVVEVNNVGADFLKKASDRAGLEQREAGLVGRQGRKDSERTFERVNHHTGRRFVRPGGLVSARGFKRIAAMDDVDFVPVPR
jgi:hypothetical protein